MSVSRILRASVGLSVLVVSGCDCNKADLVMAAATAIAGSGSKISFQTGSFNSSLVEEGVVGIMPDLVVNLGATVTVDGTEANIGESGAGAHQIGVVQKSTVVGQPDATLSQIPVASLGKGEQVSKRTTVQTVSTGIAVLEMAADFLKNVEECDGKEDNN